MIKDLLSLTPVQLQAILTHACLTVTLRSSGQICPMLFSFLPEGYYSRVPQGLMASSKQKVAKLEKQTNKKKKPIPSAMQEAY